VSDRTPTFRITSKSRVSANDVRKVQPQSYPCQAPGCDKTSDTIACPRHLAMLPLHIQNALTNALGTGEAGMYGGAMREAMQIWAEQ